MVEKRRIGRRKKIEEKNSVKDEGEKLIRRGGEWRKRDGNKETEEVIWTRRRNKKRGGSTRRKRRKTRLSLARLDDEEFTGRVSKYVLESFKARRGADSSAAHPFSRAAKLELSFGIQKLIMQMCGGGKLGVCSYRWVGRPGGSSANTVFRCKSRLLPPIHRPRYSLATPSVMFLFPLLPFSLLFFIYFTLSSCCSFLSSSTVLF